MRLERPPCTALDEQRLEHVLDPLGAAEPLDDARAAAPGLDDGQVAGIEVAGTLRVERERDARREVRVADEQPPAAVDLDDYGVGQR
jgi:hypothetical protein